MGEKIDWVVGEYHKLTSEEKKLDRLSANHQSLQLPVLQPIPTISQPGMSVHQPAAVSVTANSWALPSVVSMPVLETYNGKTKDELREEINGECKIGRAVKTLM